MAGKIKSVVSTLLVIVIVGAIAFIAMQERENDEGNMIVGIHIKGEVSNPGYYELKYGSRIKDALKMAGGETLKADLSEINLALLLSDGEEIVIPKAEKEVASGKININTADNYTLCKLDGIGGTIATRIIEYRVSTGKFKTINEIKKVDGIGDALFQKIKNYITV